MIGAYPFGPQGHQSFIGRDLEQGRPLGSQRDQRDINHSKAQLRRDTRSLEPTRSGAFRSQGPHADRVTVQDSWTSS